MSQAASCWSSAAASLANSTSAPCKAARLPSWSVSAARAARTRVPAAALPRGLVPSSRSHLGERLCGARRPMAAQPRQPPPLAHPPSLQVPPATGDRELRRRRCRPPPHHWGVPCRPSERPTLEQMHDIVDSLHMSMSRPRGRRVHGGAGRHVPGLRPRRSAARLPAAGALSAHARLSPGRRREPAQRLVR